MYKNFVKRALDLVISLVSLIALLPIILALMICYLIIENRTDFFFIQIRPGKSGKLFRLFKFKTMKTVYDSQGVLLPDLDRITYFGRFLRRTSLDEIPQLFNVLIGDMSLIGPRPLLPEYLDRYTPFEARRHEMLPGITGWAQVNGRNTLSFKKRFEYDVYYVDNVSFMFDLRIIGLTIKKIFSASDILDQDPNKITDRNE